MTVEQREHEDYWGRCWAGALGQLMDAEVSSTRPDADPPDVNFRIQRRDGAAITSWGEITGTYYDSNEAKWLWGAEDGNRSRGYVEPDAVMGEGARTLVERKSKKYSDLVRRRGQGHLLVLLHSPSTTRSTRVRAEESILDLLETGPHLELDPFETLWLGYRLPWTIPEEMEDPKYAFLDVDGGRYNFLKCISNRPGA